MLYRELGHTGLQVSAVGLGTWAIGGTFWGGTDEQQALAAIHRALDDGINLIDTAPMYGFGLAEGLIARTLKERNRDAVVVCDKVGLTWQHPSKKKYLEIEQEMLYKNLRPEAVRAEVESSLRRLRTDHLDLCVTNLPDPDTPIPETMAELLCLKDEGKIRAIGVSNVTLAQLKEYLAVGPVDAVEVLYNMLDQRLANDIVPFCRKHDIAVLAYSSLAQGLLTGRLLPERQFPSGDMRAKNPRFSATSIARINAMLAQLITLREKYHLDQTQLTLAWTISRPGITCALAGARSADQAADIARGGDQTLTKKDLTTMDEIIAMMTTGQTMSRAA